MSDDPRAVCERADGQADNLTTVGVGWRQRAIDAEARVRILATPEPDYADDPVGWQRWRDETNAALPESRAVLAGGAKAEAPSWSEGGGKPPVCHREDPARASHIEIAGGEAAPDDPPFCEKCGTSHYTRKHVPPTGSVRDVLDEVAGGEADAEPKLGGWCETHGGYTGTVCAGRQYDDRPCAGGEAGKEKP